MAAWLGTLGCAPERSQVDQHIMAEPLAAARNQGVPESYQVLHPDVLEVNLREHPDLQGKYEVQIDGRIDLKQYGRVRVEGRTAPQIIQMLAEETGSTRDGVVVRVAEFRSQHLLLFGQILGWQRRIPYQGPETVLDVLQRAGGITWEAAPDKVYVVRTHVADDRRAEIFHVDLEQVVMKNDHRTNIRVMPFDQIYVGETQQARVEKAIPIWMRPMYRTLWQPKPEAAP
ncbi:MAG: polysaccharide biosynthesis/export family protein [Gemmataceae bacterium]|nr:polysaccharide biosynthesis/export family protein [Gemmataceae bacterium]